MDFFWIRISWPRNESKDLPCKSMHFVHIREGTDHRKVCKFAKFTQCIFEDTSVLFWLKLVICKTKSQSVFAGYKFFYHRISFSNALLRIFGQFNLNETASLSYTSVKFIQ